jgi:argininosuccinate synthase
MPESDMFLFSADPRTAPPEGETVEIGFENGTPVSVNGQRMAALAVLESLNEIGGRHGVGRVDLVEDRIVGLKSRGVYETPGGTQLYAAHRELEQLVLDRRTLELKDEVAMRYARLVYEGRWWGTEKEALDALIDVTQHHVNGSISLLLCRGNIAVAGRSSSTGLYREEYATFESSGLYDHADATGFIRLFGLPYRLAGQARLPDVKETGAVTESAPDPEEMAGSDWLD